MTRKLAEAGKIPIEAGNRFAIGAGWVLSSSIIILLVGFVIKPILARWLGATALGLYSLSITIYGVSVLIGNFGISQSLIKYVAEYGRNSSKIREIASSGFISSLIVGVCVGFLLYILRDVIASFFDKPRLALSLSILALSLPFASLLQSLTGLFNGLKKMRYFALLLIAQIILRVVLVILLIKLGYGITGAIIGIALSDIVTSLLGLLLSRGFLSLRVQDYIRNFRRLLGFGAQMFGVSVINSISSRMDIFLIGYFMSATSVGLYSAAIAIANLFTIIPDAVRRMTFPNTSKLWSEGNRELMHVMFDKSLKYSACILIFLALIVGFFAKDIITLVFGHKFEGVILALYVLIIARVIRGATIVPIGSVVPAIGRPDINLKVELISVGMNVGLNILLIPRFGILGAAIGTTIALLAGGALQIIFLVRLTSMMIDFKWYAYALGSASTLILVFWVINKLINPYLAGGILLAFYAIFLLSFLLTKEDRALILALAYSLRMRR